MNITPATNDLVEAYVNENTERDTMSDLTTRQVASHLGVDTSTAFQMLNDLAKQKKITKLDPINGDKFACCGWIRNSD